MKALSKKQLIALSSIYFFVYNILYERFLSSFVLYHFGRLAYFVTDGFGMVILILLFLVIGWDWYAEHFKNFIADWQFNMLMALFMMAALFFTQDIFSFLLRGLMHLTEAENQVNNEAFAAVNLPGFFFSAVVFAPIVEETIFRGCIFQPLSRKYGCVRASLASGAIFGFLHIVASLNAMSWANCAYIFLYGACGVLLCAPFTLSETIFASVLTHSMFNLLSILMMIF